VGILSSLVLELLEVLLLELVAGLVRQVGGERSVVLLVLEGVLRFRQALSGYLLMFHLVHIKLNLFRKQTDECWVDLVLNTELFGQLDWLIILSYQDVC